MILAISAATAVSPTITPADAARMPWQAVIVGAGPAGVAAAWRLATRGIRVLLVDRHEFPRGKVCGCCLSARALRELRDLGAGELPDVAAPLDTVWLTQRGRCAPLRMPAGRVMSRETLDAALIRHAITAGCHWLPATRVASIDDRGVGTAPVTVVLGGESAAGGDHAVTTAVVVLATGLTDTVRIAGVGPTPHAHGRRIQPLSRIGVGATLAATACDLPAGRLVMAVGRDGYCGIVRLDDGRIDVAAAVDRAALARDGDPARTVARLLDEATDHTALGLPDHDAIHTAAFHATPPLTHRAPLVAGASRRILRTGDAAGYVEPFTGEGIGWALSSGRLVADALLAPAGFDRPLESADRYQTAYRREFRSAHARCRLVAGIIRRPTVVAAAVAAGRSLPWTAGNVLPAVIGATSPGGTS